MNALLPKLLIFATFFGSCIAIGLILSALVTTNWIVATPQLVSGSTSPTTKGFIQFGLFNYQKTLNHGYGERKSNFSVLEAIKSEPELMSYYLWLFTTLGTGFALFSSTFAAVASVIGTIRKDGGVFVMVVSNVAAGIGQLVAFICWTIQFAQYLTHNVLMQQDQGRWTSKDQSTFGYSFYLIILSFFLVLINIILLTISARIQREHRKSLEGPVEEKEGNSIMLY